METKHTKGEWRLPHFVNTTTCNCGYILADTVCVGEVFFRRDDSTEESEHPDLEEAIANAKLIAAAPELLKALKGLHELALDGYNSHVQSGSHEEFLKEDRELLKNALSAIKKATE